MKRFVLSLVLANTLAISQTIPDRTYREILSAQDGRDSQSLALFLTHRQPEVRARAALACASVQDTSHIAILTRLLFDHQYSVRAAAAFALGQMNAVLDSAGRASVSHALAKRLGVEQSRSVAARIAEALGKAGNQFSLDILVAAGRTSPYVGVRSEAALSVGRYAYRGIKSKTAAQFAADMVEALGNDQGWKAAYALMRIGDSTLLSKHADVLQRAASSANADIRMFAVSALGKSGLSRDALNALLSASLQGGDWRVRVNAVRVLSGVDVKSLARVIPVLLTVVSDSNEHVSLTAVTTLGAMGLAGSAFAWECRKALVEVMNDPRYSQRQKREAAIALAKIVPDDAFLILSTQRHLGHLTKESFAAALGNVPSTESLQALIGFAAEGNRSLYRVCLESVVEGGKLAHEDSAYIELAKPLVLEAVLQRDLPLVAIAAAALSDSTFVDKRAPALLIESMKQLRTPEDAEALISVIQALGDLKATAAVAPLESELNNSDHAVALEAARALKKISGKSYDQLVKPRAQPTYTNDDWKLLDAVRKNPLVRVRTTQGVFSFRMLPDEAPFTCIRFASLMKQGFFDSLLFHRVVPNFVIQGGDPRGDGWGGPGFRMRSEFGFEHYVPGAVGVASSGKDTEGCQWFVTHCNTPHLDGRYTIFAMIVSGMEVVNRIHVGERIVKMEFSR